MGLDRACGSWDLQSFTSSMAVPGEAKREEVLKEMGLTQQDLAQAHLQEGLIIALADVRQIHG